MRVIYVAGPFRAPTPEGIEANIRNAEELGKRVAKLGVSTIIPHANTRNFHGEFDEDFMLESTLALAMLCDAMILVPKWELSQGTRGEIRAAINMGIPVFVELSGLESWLKGVGNV